MALIAGGVAVVVATRDEELRPDIARGWAPQVSEDGRDVTLCLSVHGRRTVDNLERRSEIAATFSLPTTYRSVQMKGVVVDVGEPTSAHMERARGHLEAFGREATQVGVPARHLARFFDTGRFVAVTFRVRELYDQTPGATAGARL